MTYILKLILIIIISISFSSNHILFAQDQQINVNIVNFNSEAALNRSQQIVEEYFRDYSESVSRYVGRVWFDNISKGQSIGDISLYEDFLNELQSRNLEKIRMDCTIYCQKCLKAGMSSEDYSKLVNYHSELWPGKGFAGWSVGYLLVDRFGWKAYAFIERDADYYYHYLSHFENKKEYPVWNQPNTKIEEFYILGEDNEKIEQLLSEHKFSWGFSEDGIHTWITNYTDLRESHWDGPPAERYNPDNSFPLLFETTRFVEFEDYDVHLIIFPK